MGLFEAGQFEENKNLSLLLEDLYHQRLAVVSFSYIRVLLMAVSSALLVLGIHSPAYAITRTVNCSDSSASVSDIVLLLRGGTMTVLAARGSDPVPPEPRRLHQAVLSGSEEFPDGREILSYQIIEGDFLAPTGEILALSFSQTRGRSVELLIEGRASNWSCR